MERSDAELVRDTLRGNQEAFGTLVDRHRRTLYALALQRGYQSVEAEDITQETFFKAYRSLGALRDPSLFERWLYGIANHVMADWRRSKSRRPEEWALDNTPEPMVPATEQTAIGFDEERARVLGALRRLSEDHRVVLSLRYLYELSPKQIAERLKKPRGTIRSRLHHALKDLQRILGTKAQKSIRQSNLLDAPPEE